MLSTSVTLNDVSRASIDLSLRVVDLTDSVETELGT